jgi:prepilin-type N-terminal cleavage/methylation domain-containing protein
MVRKGFTLLELLIVISIIGILVAVATASYSSSQSKARNSRRMSDMKSVQNAAEQYFADNNSSYPDLSSTFGVTYLPGGFPVEPKPLPYAAYNYAAGPSGCDNVTELCTTYSACAQTEGAIGNADSSTGLNYGGTPTSKTYYCVTNLQ